MSEASRSAPARLERRSRAPHLLRTARGMSRLQWEMLVRATGWVVVTRVGLALLPWSRASSLLEGPPVRAGDPDGPRAQAALWAVRAVAKRLLRDRPCLTQALVARRLLRRYGFETTLRIGAARGEGGAFEAHAWLERGGTVVIGGRESGVRYRTFEAIGPRAAAPYGPDAAVTEPS